MYCDNNLFDLFVTHFTTLTYFDQFASITEILTAYVLVALNQVGNLEYKKNTKFWAKICVRCYSLKKNCSALSSKTTSQWIFYYQVLTNKKLFISDAIP